MDLAHGVADVEPGLRLHYVTAGEGERTIVLLHASTWWGEAAGQGPMVFGP